MREVKKKRLTQVTEVTVSETVTCNRCGKSTISVKDEHNFDIDLYHNVGFSFGYGSNFDMERWSFDICEDCLVDFIKTFKHVPSGFQLDPSIILVENESDEHQMLFDHWKKTGEWDDLKFKTHEELVELKDVFIEGYIDEIIAERFPSQFDK